MRVVCTHLLFISHLINTSEKQITLQGFCFFPDETLLFLVCSTISGLVSPVYRSIHIDLVHENLQCICKSCLSISLPEGGREGTGWVSIAVYVTMTVKPTPFYFYGIVMRMTFVYIIISVKVVTVEIFPWFSTTCVQLVYGYSRTGVNKIILWKDTVILLNGV